MECSVSMWKPGQLESCSVIFSSWVQHYPKSDVLRIAVLKKIPLDCHFVICYTVHPTIQCLDLGGGVVFKALHLMPYFHIKLFISKPLHKQCFCSIISGLGKCSQTAFIVISNHMLQINGKS